jgi:superfamily II DNA or RNA helicase
MSIVIKIGNYTSMLEGELDDLVALELYRRLAYQKNDAFFQAEAYNSKSDKEWDGWTRLYFPDRRQSFYTGLMSEVTSLFKEAKVKYRINDLRTIPPQNLPNLKFSPTSDKQPRPYQKQTVDACIAYTRGIVQAATGAGKTYIITELIGSLKTAPFIFLVPSIDLLEQTHDTLSSCLNVPIGLIGDGHSDVQDISVMTVQTAVRSLHSQDSKFKVDAYKYDDDEDWDENFDKSKSEQIKKYIQDCNGIFMDEGHHAATKTAEDIMRAAKKAYWRFTGSATPYREDGADLMIQALFGRKLVNISPSYLIERDFLVRPHIFNVKMDGRHGDFLTYSKVYKHWIVENEPLNKLVATTMRYLASANISTLVLVQRYDHGERLQALCPGTPFIRGDMPRNERKMLIQDLKSGKVKTCIATTLADEGLDVRRLGAVLIPGGGKSTTRVYQRVGRVLRPFEGKTKAIAVLFQHDARFLKEHGSRVRKLMEDEPAFIVTNCKQQELLNEIAPVVYPQETLFGEIL